MQNILNTIYKNQNLLRIDLHPEFADVVEKLFSDIQNEVLYSFGFPLLDKSVRFVFSEEERAGFYSRKQNTTFVFQKENKNIFSYLRTIYHESAHIVEHFVVENELTFNKVDKLTQDEFEKLLKSFFKNKYIDNCNPDVEKFKLFYKQDPFFQKTIFPTFLFDHYFYHDFKNVYYNSNLTELRAEWVAYSVLKNKYIENIELPVSDFVLFMINETKSFAFDFKLKDMNNLVNSKKYHFLPQILFSRNLFKAFKSAVLYKNKYKINFIKPNVFDPKNFPFLVDKINSDLMISTLFDSKDLKCVCEINSSIINDISDLDDMIQSYESDFSTECINKKEIKERDTEER